MNEKRNDSVWYNYTFRVIFTWLWFFIGAILVILVFFMIKGFDLESTMEILTEERHLMVYIEFSSVGFMPLMLTIVCKDDVKLYGFNREKIKLFKSISLSLIFVALMYSIGYVINGKIMSYTPPTYKVETPWNYFYGIASVFTWGPLEMFFFVWLVVNTEFIFREGGRMISKGFLITLLIFALTHVITTDIGNAVYTALLFFILGLIYKYSDNIIGPAIAWTMINGTVWMVSHLFLV